MNKKLIEQLRNGEIAVENDGTLEQLKRVLKSAFKKDKSTPVGNYKIYRRYNKKEWTGITPEQNRHYLPTVSVKEFFKDENMKNNLPLIGTKVFHHVYGEGEIENCYEERKYPIVANFSGDKRVFEHQELSLTPYTVEGFTPISDYDKPKVGDWGYFWDDENEPHVLAYGCLKVMSHNKYYFEVTSWENFSKEIPPHIKKLQNK